MIHTTPSDAIAEIKRLGLPRIFCAVWSDTLKADPAVPDYLKSEWRRPHVEISDLDRDVPGLAGLLPLWEFNGDAIVGRLPDGRFVEFYYEEGGLDDPNSAITILGNNYQQFVTTILEGMMDSGLWDEYGDAVANILGYKYTKELLAVVQAWTDETWTDAEGLAAFARFRESLA